MMSYQDMDRMNSRQSNRKRTWWKFVIVLICALVVALLVYGISSSGGTKPGSKTLTSDGMPESYSGPFSADSVIMIGKTGKQIGVLSLSQATNDGPVTITGEIAELSPNSKHAFHVHTYGDLRQGCDSTGTHFNPFNQTHSGPTATSRHVGDLGNIETDSNGTAKVHIEDNVISLAPGVSSIIGRAFVVHEGVDDLGKGGVPESLTTGNAGTKYGCGIIGIAAPTTSK